MVLAVFPAVSAGSGLGTFNKITDHAPLISLGLTPESNAGCGFLSQFKHP